MSRRGNRRRVRTWRRLFPLAIAPIGLLFAFTGTPARHPSLGALLRRRYQRRG